MTQQTYHRFGSQEAFQQALEGLEPGVREALDLDVIGKLFDPTGEYTLDAAGEPVEAIEELLGWHVNVTRPEGVALPPAFAEREVFPDSPVRPFP